MHTRPHAIAPAGTCTHTNKSTLAHTLAHTYTHTHANSQDRLKVAERMKLHVSSADSVPLLIFPEGTCVNNEYTVLFKRGAFELGAAVCPIAIK